MSGLSSVRPHRQPLNCHSGPCANTATTLSLRGKKARATGHGIAQDGQSCVSRGWERSHKVHARARSRGAKQRQRLGLVVVQAAVAVRHAEFTDGHATAARLPCGCGCSLPATCTSRAPPATWLYTAGPCLEPGTVGHCRTRHCRTLPETSQPLTKLSASTTGSEVNRLWTPGGNKMRLGRPPVAGVTKCA